MKITHYLLLAAIITMAACNGKRTTPDTETEMQDSIATEIKDSTIIGIASDEFGMSTFAVIPEGTDTLLVLDRTHADGSEAQIFGDLQPDDKFALTTRDNGASLDKVINLTQLGKFVADFEICNATPIINGDTIEIVTLDSSSLTYKKSDGELVKKTLSK